MNELTREDIQNLLAFVGRASVQGQEQEVAVMLKMKLSKMIQAMAQPNQDGAKLTEDIPAEVKDEA